MNNYEEILYYPHFEPSIKHPRMSIYNRSAQFAPFDALTGFDEEIIEVARITTQKIELDEEQKEIINNILVKLKINDEIKIRYFIKDKTKSGGKYICTAGKIKKIDKINKVIYLYEKTLIPVENIIEIII